MNQHRFVSRKQLSDQLHQLIFLPADSADSLLYQGGQYLQALMPDGTKLPFLELEFPVGSLNRSHIAGLGGHRV